MTKTYLGLRLNVECLKIRACPKVTGLKFME